MLFPDFISLDVPYLCTFFHLHVIVNYQEDFEQDIVHFSSCLYER